MKFIQCADVHLDTPLPGLAYYPDAPVNEIKTASAVAVDAMPGPTCKRGTTEPAADADPRDFPSTGLWALTVTR